MNSTAAGWSGQGRGVTSQRSPTGRLATVALILATVLAGCQTTSTDYAPPVAVPDGFSAAGTTALPDTWWQSFDDPVLDDLIAQALGGNLNVRSAWDRLVQAEAVARKAGAGLLPSIDGEADLSGTRKKAANSAGRRVITSSSEISLGLSSSYEVDLWGEIRSTRDAARFDLSASEEDLKTAAITLTADVAATWYQLVEKYGQKDLLASQMATNQQILEVVTLRFRRGQVSATDVLQQRQQIESKQGDIVSTDSDIAVLRHQLAILLGKAPTELEAPRVNALLTLPALPDTGLPAELIRRRPDIRKAYFKVQAADRRTAAAIADRFPRLTLAATVNTSGELVRDLFNNWLGSLAAGLVAPLFDAGERAAEVDRTRAVTAEALNDYGATVLDSLGEVEDALSRESHQRQYLASLEKQIDLSDQAFQRIRDTYVSGASDYLKVLDALLTNQTLERTHLEAQRKLIEYRVNLCRALGGGWEMIRPASAGLTPDSPTQPDHAADQGRRG